YRLWSDLPFLKDRKTYRDYCVPWRIEHIRSRIRENKPKFVVFMGQVYFKYWQAITESSFSQDGGFWIAKSGNTTYVITKHPAARGVTNAYFETIGKYLSQQ